MGRNSNTMLWKRAREAGRLARQVQERRGVPFEAHAWREAFLCFVASEYPGIESVYRQFAIGFDESNKKWAEGNDD